MTKKIGRPSSEKDRRWVRLPDELWKLVDELSHQNVRTTDLQIQAMLTESAHREGSALTRLELVASKLERLEELCKERHGKLDKILGPSMVTDETEDIQRAKLSPEVLGDDEPGEQPSRQSRDAARKDKRPGGSRKGH